MTGIATLCGSGLYANEVACEIDNYISDFVAKAEASETALDTALNDFTAAYEQNITPVDYKAVTPSLTAAINKAFTAPTEVPTRGDYASLEPVDVTLPARAGLITDWDSVFAPTRSRIARVTAAQYRTNVSGAGAVGLGMSSPAQTAAIREAQQKQTEGVLQAALEQSSQETTAEREDVRLILELEIRNYTEKWGVIRTRLAAEEETLRAKIDNYLAQVQREAEKREWTQLQIDDILRQAKDSAETAVAWGRLTLDKLMQAEEVVIRMKAAVFQTWLQAADLSLTFSGSQDVNDNSS